MKRIYIVVEGQTEQAFVNNLLRPYLNTKGIYSVTPILIKTSKIGRGGFVNYTHLYNTIKGILATSSDDIVVSTFVDFFRIPASMPFYNECMSLRNDVDRVDALERALRVSVGDRRFIPYIQLHEFEALLFSSNKGFEEFFAPDKADKTAAIISSFVNPEDINSSPETAPSKRLLSIDKRYDKVLQGNLIAMEVGIGEMLLKCRRFSEWVTSLVDSASAS